jgi:hypothetical protein
MKEGTLTPLFARLLYALFGARSGLRSRLFCPQNLARFTQAEWRTGKAVDSLICKMLR